MVIFLAMAAFGVSAVVVIVAMWRLTQNNRTLAAQATHYAVAAGKARQALHDASIAPNLDPDTANYLSVVMAELDRGALSKRIEHDR